MTSANRHNGGFSLVELLVAMAIFLTVFTGVVALFGGAVQTVRQGYRTMEGFELGRGALEALTRDLEGAFTARDQGQALQFYGRPEGFTFVTMLPSGALGRVTYVIHPSSSTEPFDTVVTEVARNLWDTSGVDYPHYGEARKSLAFKQGYEEALDLGFLEAAAVAEGDKREAMFIAAYPPPSDKHAVIEFPVRVQTYALVRYEEAPIRVDRPYDKKPTLSPADLHTFELPFYEPWQNPQLSDPIPWPHIDREDPRYDAVRADDPGGLNSPIGRTIYEYLLTSMRGLDNDGGVLGVDQDLREQMIGTILAGRPLRALNSRIIEQLTALKRRELWIHMLAEDVVFQSLNQRGLPRFWDLVDLDVRDYVVADRLRAAALLLNPANLSETLPIDLLYSGGVFSYGNGSGASSNYFNDMRKSVGDFEYRAYLMSPNEGTLLSFDDALAASIGAAEVSAADFGSPLRPRIPATIGIGFWIMQDKPQPGSSDFRRWFSQLVDVPAGFSRGMPPNMTRNPG